MYGESHKKPIPKVSIQSNTQPIKRKRLRFIGWVLLCILTLGIGFLWLSPYIQISYAKFYEDIKAA